MFAVRYGSLADLCVDLFSQCILRRVHADISGDHTRHSARRCSIHPCLVSFADGLRSGKPAESDSCGARSGDHELRRVIYRQWFDLSDLGNAGVLSAPAVTETIPAGRGNLAEPDIRDALLCEHATVAWSAGTVAGSRHGRRNGYCEHRGLRARQSGWYTGRCGDGLCRVRCGFHDRCPDLAACARSIS